MILLCFLPSVVISTIISGLLVVPIHSLPLSGVATGETNTEVGPGSSTTQPHESEDRKLKTTVSLKKEEACICTNAGDFVLTDKEYEQVLERLRDEAIRNAMHNDSATIGPDTDTETRRTQIIDLLDNLNLDTVENKTVLNNYKDQERSKDGEYKSTCPICLEDLENGDDLVLQCEHKFHTECVKKWNEKRQTCPLCGGIIKPRLRILCT